MNSPRTPNVPLRQARLDRGWTLEDVATAVYNATVKLGEPEPAVDANLICKWELGYQRPTPRHARYLCAVYHMRAPELGLPDRPVRIGHDLEVGRVGRHRDATEGGTPGPRAAPDASSRVPHMAHDATDPDMAAMDAFRVADRQIGGGHLYAAALSYLNAFIGPRLLTSRAGSFTAAASLTEMAGWMAHDSGRDEMARTHFDRAWDLARVAQSAELRGDVAAARAHLELHLGNPAGAVEIAGQGRVHVARGPCGPGLTARLYSMEARGLAELGRKHECIRMLGRAETSFGARGGQASPWVAPFDVFV